MKTEEILYAVKLKAKKGSACQRDSFALGFYASSALFYNRTRARAFRGELIPHIKQKGRVVKVRVTIEEI